MNNDTPPPAWYDPLTQENDCEECEKLNCDDGKLSGFDGDGCEVIENCPCLPCHRPDEAEAISIATQADFLYDLNHGK